MNARRVNGDREREGGISRRTSWPQASETEAAPSQGDEQGTEREGFSSLALGIRRAAARTWIFIFRQRRGNRMTLPPGGGSMGGSASTSRSTASTA